MNLVRDKWIPVVRKNLKGDVVSLMDIYIQGDDISDLAVNSIQRISLTRLFACISHAALGGPEDHEEWFNIRNTFPEISAKYLESFQHKFNLLGDGSFLQANIDGLVDKDGKPLYREKNGKIVTKAITDKLNVLKASNNCPTLFDHASVKNGRSPLKTEVALDLLTFQMFSCGGPTCSKGMLWEGELLEHAAKASPCAADDRLHTILLGESILETIHLNLIPKSEITPLEYGKPYWEYNVLNKKVAEELTNYYLGRLVPITRIVKLFEGKTEDRVSNCCVIAIPYKHENESAETVETHRDPWATTLPKAVEKGSKKLQNQKPELKYLGNNSEEQPWVSLASILALTEGGALTLSNIKFLEKVMPDSSFSVWTGGCKLYSPKSPTKVVEISEWVFTLPVKFLDCLKNFEDGVSVAKRNSYVLSKGIKLYCKKAINEQKIKGIPKKLPLEKSAKRKYWTIVNMHENILIECINNRELNFQDPDNRWTRITTKAMFDVYDQLCNRNSPRRIHGYVQGKEELLK